ncbi:hypothetical protein [Phytoactinopolyspora endophytica]|uniref:hypothetical protein n=1 Tax=Phytoactinopolyspora endophytica TaxID=1642495 RepID=UPI00101B614D|nr:hypothetical protein [Phytoactinopolyspora endophytica]
MDTWVWIIVLIVAIVVVAAVVYMLTMRRRSAQLQKRFGPEYDRAVESTRERNDVEKELRDIADRRDRTVITPLSPDARRQYSAQWQAIQNSFVDQPVSAVAEADDLIVSVMAERGYPVDDFVERTDMVSADHPETVSHYRAANALRRKGTDATTEELREAFVHYRFLFDQMLVDDGDQPEGGGGTSSTHRGDRRHDIR